VAEGPRIAHVGIAVPDLEQALPFYREVLGLEPHAPETADGAIILSLPFGDTEVELLAPASSAAARAFITSATGCPIWTPHWPRAAEPAIA
jgi:catechol 2,3-dioxygenase-like lactoylglutathione lyase family enzyme